MRPLESRRIIAVALVLAGCATESGSLLGGVEAVPPSASTPATDAAVTTVTTSPPITTTTTLQPLAIAFAGDTSFTHGLASYDPLGEVSYLLSAPDLALVNLETTIAEADVGSVFAKEYAFKSPPESAGLLAAAGVDGVALGNNHTLDYGQPALMRTMELLKEAGLAWAGAGRDQAEAYAPMIFERTGGRVAVLSFSRVLSRSDWAADADRAGIASAYDEWILDTVAAVERAAISSDVVAVMVHWGIELDYCPEPFQRELAAAWVEAGAELVVGSHPHVLQGVERIDDAWVVYSTGNFAFPSARGLSDDSALFEFTIDEAGIDFVVHPIHLINGRPHPASEEKSAEIFALLSDHSFGYVLDERGVAVRSGRPGGCE